MDYVLQLLKAFANERRLQIVKLLLKKGELFIEEIAEELKIPLATCCRNLKILEKAYVVLSRYKNGRALYKLNNPNTHIYNKLIIELIKLSEEKREKTSRVKRRHAKSQK